MSVALAGGWLLVGCGSSDSGSTTTAAPSSTSAGALQPLQQTLIDVVKTSDIIDSGDKLSSIDHFHPGASADHDVARRIADMLTEQIKTF